MTALKASLEHIRTITKNNPRVSIVVGGSFNAKDFHWDSYSLIPWCHETMVSTVCLSTFLWGAHAPLCEALSETLQAHHLEQLQKSPTNQGEDWSFHHRTAEPEAEVSPGELHHILWLHPGCAELLYTTHLHKDTNWHTLADAEIEVQVWEEMLHV